MSVFDRSARLGATSHLDAFPVGAYLTDGRRLVYVEAQTQEHGRGTVVEIEDCKTLELSIWSPRSLARAGFKLVRPKEAAAGEGTRTDRGSARGAGKARV
jgi:hypothetical protein